MQRFEENVAVITGTASGIGRAIAERCIGERMKVVLADIEPASWAETETGTEQAGRRIAGREDRRLPVR